MRKNLKAEVLIALNPLGGVNLPNELPDTIKRIPTTIDKAVDDAVMFYDKLWDGTDEWQIHSKISELKESERLPPILNPTQLDLLLQKLAYHQRSGHAATWQYFRDLMQASYNAGHNDFRLTTHNLKDVVLCSMLHFCKERRGKVVIYGDTSSKSAMDLRRCDLTLKGGSDDLFGQDAQYCRILHYGDVGVNSYIGASHCRIQVRGDCCEGFGDRSNFCEYTVHGSVGRYSFVDASRCVVRTPNRATFKDLKRYIRRASVFVELIP